MKTDIAMSAAYPNGWQPIKTAPAKGAYLVYQPADLAGRIGLRARMCFVGDAGPHRRTTHWMHLPPPPEPLT